MLFTIVTLCTFRYRFLQSELLLGLKYIPSNQVKPNETSIASHGMDLDTRNSVELIVVVK